MRLALFLAVTSYAAPCTIPSNACTEWISVAQAPERLLIYRSHSIEMKNAAITRALILVHGGARDAENQFRSALAAAFLAGALDNTVIIAPRFSSNRGNTQCHDLLAKNEANWGCADGQPDSWRNGAATMGNNSLTSYDFADEILRRLAHKDVFPNLKAIVVAGHSGGGQFALRYGMSNQVQDKLNIPITYVVSNPDALVYADTLRPTAAAYPVIAAAPGYVPPAPTAAFVPFADARNCAGYDNWPYGLQHRTGYTTRVTDSQIRKQLATRHFVYLSGGLDVFPIEGFDQSCPAMAQGPTRFARSYAFSQYLREKFEAKGKVIVLPTCGHDARCIFTAEQTSEIIFPK